MSVGIRKQNESGHKSNWSIVILESRNPDTSITNMVLIFTYIANILKNDSRNTNDIQSKLFG